MLKNTRLIAALLWFSLITLYFLDIASVLPDKMARLAKMQFVPALLAHSTVILIILIGLTMILGRIYCSVICPLGVFQDIVGWFSSRFGKKNRYKYFKPLNVVRYSFLAVFMIGLIAGIMIIPALIDPYSLYGRMITSLIKPLYQLGNNLMADVTDANGSYYFARNQVYIASLASLIISAVSVVTIKFLMWKYGRIYCNSVCPVGTILGVVSKFAIFKIAINTEQCNNCGLCARRCKASCIDSKNHAIDYSRCIACYNCIGVCKRDAITYKYQPNKKSKEVLSANVDHSKRRFFGTAIATSVAVPKIMAHGAGEDIITKVTGRSVPKREIPLSPAGSLAVKRLNNHCTSCHLCIAKCPNNVLRPSVKEYGITNIMQPVMYYEKGFCDYNCNLCSTVCPNGAISKVSIEEKQKIKIGYASLNIESCVVVTDKEECGNCSRHCPVDAIRMLPYEDKRRIPKVDTELCIGCGACEFHCPAKPFTAIYVEGYEVHKA